MDLLKLVAFDADDMAVVSTHLQDATIKVADVLWRPQEKRLILAMDRFDWEGFARHSPEFRRRRTALRFDRVLSCKCRDVKPEDKNGILNLLAVEFAETSTPAGVVTLLFAGGGALRLEVECLEAELADLGPVWATDCCPQHATDDLRKSA